MIRQTPPRSLSRVSDRLLDPLLEAGKGFLRHRSHLLAAAISYYSLLSLLPLLYFSILLLGTLVGSSQQASLEVLALFSSIFPGPVPAVSNQLQALVGGSALINILAVASLFVGTGMVFMTLETAVSMIQERPVERMKFFRGVVWGYLMVLLLGGLVVVTHFLSIGLSWMTGKEIVFAGVPLSRIGEDLFVRWGPSVLVFLFFGFMLYLAPRPRPPLALTGATSLVITVIWEGMRKVFIWYTADVVNLSVVYGPLSSIIAFIIFVYLSSVLFLFGTEYMAAVRKGEGKERGNQ